MNNRLPPFAELCHASDSLGLYRAELARILGLKCAEVSDAKCLRDLLQQDQAVRERAERFVYFYRLLERKFAGDSVSLVHWLRKSHARLGTTPFLAIVDQARIEDVIAQLH